MTANEQFVDERGPVSRMQYDDGTLVLAADVGQQSETTVDVLGDTVILVVDDEQYEFQLPEETGADAQAFMKNGVLTVEVEG